MTYYVAENATIGSAIGEISATDPDENANAVVEYSIVGGPDASSFALVTRSDGRPPLLSNLIELDHEGQKCDYKLIIRASSAHLQTDVSVVIVVTDVNGNHQFQLENVFHEINLDYDKTKFELIYNY